MADKEVDVWFCHQPGTGGTIFQRKEDAEWAAKEKNQGRSSFAGQEDVRKRPYRVDRTTDSPASAIKKEDVDRWKRGY